MNSPFTNEMAAEPLHGGCPLKRPGSPLIKQEDTKKLKSPVPGGADLESRLARLFESPAPSGDDAEFQPTEVQRSATPNDDHTEFNLLESPGSATADEHDVESQLSEPTEESQTASEQDEPGFMASSAGAQHGRDAVTVKPGAMAVLPVDVIAQGDALEEKVEEKKGDEITKECHCFPTDFEAAGVRDSAGLEPQAEQTKVRKMREKADFVEPTAGVQNEEDAVTTKPGETADHPVDLIAQEDVEELQAKHGQESEAAEQLHCPLTSADGAALLAWMEQRQQAKQAQSRMTQDREAMYAESIEMLKLKHTEELERITFLWRKKLTQVMRETGWIEAERAEEVRRLREEVRELEDQAKEDMDDLKAAHAAQEEAFETQAKQNRKDLKALYATQMKDAQRTADHEASKKDVLIKKLRGEKQGLSKQLEALASQTIELEAAIDRAIREKESSRQAIELLKMENGDLRSNLWQKDTDHQTLAGKYLSREKDIDEKLQSEDRRWKHQFDVAQANAALGEQHRRAFIELRAHNERRCKQIAALENDLRIAKAQVENR